MGCSPRVCKELDSLKNTLVTPHSSYIGRDLAFFWSSSISIGLYLHWISKFSGEFIIDGKFKHCDTGKWYKWVNRDIYGSWYEGEHMSYSRLASSASPQITTSLSCPTPSALLYPVLPLDWKGITSVRPKGNQSWVFTGRTGAEAEAPRLWPPDGKNWLLGKDPDAGKDWRWEEKGTTEDAMVEWHHRLDGHESESAPGVGDGQGSLECCSPWACMDSWSDKSRTRLSDWTEVSLFKTEFLHVSLKVLCQSLVH